MAANQLLLAEVGAGVELLADHQLGSLAGGLADGAAGGRYHHLAVAGPGLLHQRSHQDAH